MHGSKSIRWGDIARERTIYRKRPHQTRVRRLHRHGAWLVAVIGLFAWFDGFHGATRADNGQSNPNAPTIAKPSLMILPFDVVNYSLDNRPDGLQALRKWVAALPGEIRESLNDKSKFAIFEPLGLSASFNSQTARYQYPTQCRSCMLDIGKDAHAHYILVGQVTKLSNLLTFFDMQIIDIRNDETVTTFNLRSDGANDESLWPHIAQSIASRIKETHL